jgi:hypothetical protein
MNADARFDVIHRLSTKRIAMRFADLSCSSQELQSAAIGVHRRLPHIFVLGLHFG